MAAVEPMTIVVVGAGIAGVAAVRGIRAVNQDATVVLVNGETYLPYRRPQLSRNLHTGASPDQFAIEPENWYHDHGITLITGAKAKVLDTDARTLVLDDGRVLPWNRLILATGAVPRWPEAAAPDVPGLFVLREAEDAEALLATLQGCRSVLIIGMGVLGVEVAEQARLRGLVTTGIHQGPYPMDRDLTVQASARLQKLMEQNGIALFFNKTVSAVARVPDGLLVSWNGGARIADVVVACVGSQPNTALAAAAGLEVGQGIRVDGHLCTSFPDVFAAGDCAELPGGATCHLWHAAEAMGRAAGLNAAGSPAPYHIRPFRLKCEVFGDYFFSMNRPEHDQLSALHVDERTSGSLYQCFFFRVGFLDGVVMAGDRDRARRYEEAVWHRWPRDQVLKALAL